tara:strand:- start:207 stop:473 length:267 start_codon:yes stop_codon:yes gene_type:complete
VIAPEGAVVRPAASTAVTKALRERMKRMIAGDRRECGKLDGASLEQSKWLTKSERNGTTYLLQEEMRRVHPSADIGSQGLDMENSLPT